jgi:hypothetical protein
VCHERRVSSLAARNCTRDEGGPFAFGDQEPISSHRKLLPPPEALSGLGVKLSERTVKATRPNVSDVCDVVAGAADLRWRFKTGQRVHRALTVHPVGVRRLDPEERRRPRRSLPAIAMGHSQFPVALTLIGQVVEKGFAVLGNEGVEIDERANPVRHSVGDVAYDDTAIGMSDQDDSRVGSPKS